MIEYIILSFIIKSFFKFYAFYYNCFITFISNNDINKKYLIYLVKIFYYYYYLIFFDKSGYILLLLYIL